MSKLFRAYCLKFFGMIAGSTGPSTFLLVVVTMNREMGVMYFLMLGSLFMLSLSFVLNNREWRNGTIRKNLTVRTIVPLVIAGLAVSVSYICYTYSMQLRTVTEAVLIIRINPLINIILARLILKERIKSWKGIVLAMVICLMGMVVMEGIRNINVGNLFGPFMLFALATAFLYSLESVMERSAQKNGELPESFISGAEMFIGAVVLFVWAIKSGLPFIIPDGKQLALLVYLGVCTIGIPTFASLRAYKLVDNFSRFAFLQYFFPIFAAISAYLINGERGLNYGNLAMGFVLISIGIWIADRCIEKGSAHNLTEEGEEHVRY